MNVRFIIISVVMSFVFPVFGQNNIKWTNLDLVSEKVQNSNRKFIVYFYYDGCKWCKFMEETTLNNDHLARFINQNFYAFRVNALSEEKLVIGDRSYTSVRIGKYDFNELAADLLSGNMSFPSFVFLDEKFNKIQAYEGYLDMHNFEMILSYYGGNHHKNTLWKRFSNNYCRDSHFNSLVKR
ncbi:MAG: DUF255 domain-containing protein [Saprospiraceae bacterium]|nr:DUF255 domain-containing protein [Saprospiraceae bacterium]